MGAGFLWGFWPMTVSPAPRTAPSRGEHWNVAMSVDVLTTHCLRVAVPTGATTVKIRDNQARGCRAHLSHQQMGWERRFLYLDADLLEEKMPALHSTYVFSHRLILPTTLMESDRLIPFAGEISKAQRSKKILLKVTHLVMAEPELRGQHPGLLTSALSVIMLLWASSQGRGFDLLPLTARLSGSAAWEFTQLVHRDRPALPWIRLRAHIPIILYE